LFENLLTFNIVNSNKFVTLNLFHENLIGNSDSKTIYIYIYIYILNKIMDHKNKVSFQIYIFK